MKSFAFTRYGQPKDRAKRGARKVRMDQRRMAEANARAARQELEESSWQSWEQGSQEEC